MDRRGGMPALESGSMSYLVSAQDPPDLSQEVRRLFDDLAKRRPDRRPFVAGECSPTLDVLETERTVEVVVDVPGIPADGLRLLIKNGILLIVGEKDRAEPSRTPTSFHLVERDFGRFARAVRISGSVDASRARATLAHGELRVVIPKIVERRGREVLVPIETGHE
jgi:HSP20 family protein